MRLGFKLVIGAGAGLAAAIVPAGAAFAALPDSKPYDDRLLRLSEILCSALSAGASMGNDGIRRERMKELMEAEVFLGAAQSQADAQLQSGIPKLQSHVCHLQFLRADRDRRFFAEVQISESLTKSFP